MCPCLDANTLCLCLCLDTLCSDATKILTSEAATESTTTLGLDPTKARTDRTGCFVLSGIRTQCLCPDTDTSVRTVYKKINKMIGPNTNLCSDCVQLCSGCVQLCPDCVQLCSDCVQLCSDCVQLCSDCSNGATQRHLGITSPQKEMFHVLTLFWFSRDPGGGF